jgi:crotonobetainyl-CoA:carnitine CoA-transferase CaiB-like acyl-CoA transferase
MPSDRPILSKRDTAPSGPTALDGIRVIDFTRVLAGPFATQILGDLGADIIKIENPRGGDDTRAVRRQDGLGAETPMFMALNRSKRSIAIDLTVAEGRAVVLDLIATADILVENFTGRVMRRFGLDYAKLKERFPRLIYCSISGYGRAGANADAAGYDSPVSAEAGVTALNAIAGGSPVLGGIPFTDITTALNATIAILAALHARARTGEGQHVDVALFDSALANLSYQGCEYLMTGHEPPLFPQQLPGPRGLFETADGSIVVTCSSDKMFRALCLDVLERPDLLEDARFAVLTERMRHGAALLTELRTIFASRARDDWSRRCKQAGIPCGPVRSVGEALTSREAMERELVFGLPHPVAGLAPAIAQPFRLSATPCRYETPPLLGEHTQAILSELPGYDAAYIAALVGSGAVVCGAA